MNEWMDEWMVVYKKDLIQSSARIAWATDPRLSSLVASEMVSMQGVCASAHRQRLVLYHYTVVA